MINVLNKVIKQGARNCMGLGVKAILSSEMMQMKKTMVCPSGGRKSDLLRDCVLHTFKRLFMFNNQRNDE